MLIRPRCLELSVLAAGQQATNMRDPPPPRAAGPFTGVGLGGGLTQPWGGCLAESGLDSVPGACSPETSLPVGWAHGVALCLAAGGQRTGRGGGPARVRVSEVRTVSVARIAKGTLLNEEGLPINLSFLENEVFFI